MLNFQLSFFLLILLMSFISMITMSKNLMNFLMIMELMLLMMVMLFCMMSYYSNLNFGLTYSMLMMVVAASETSMGLMLMISFYKMKGNMMFKNMNLLK